MLIRPSRIWSKTNTPTVCRAAIYFYNCGLSVDSASKKMVYCGKGRVVPSLKSLLFMRVLFFAQIKDATGCDSVEITLPSSLNAEQLWAELIKKFPKLEAYRSSVRLAKNFEYAAPDATFADADEVALIPPVSGG